MSASKLSELNSWIPRYKKWSLLPELLKFLGEDKLQDFIQIFGGFTFTVPTQYKWDLYLRNFRIYKRLRQGRSSAVLDSLAEHYALSTERIRHIFYEVRQCLEDE